MSTVSTTTFWGSLSGAQRIGLGVGAAAIVALSLGIGVWAMRDVYVPLASNLGTDRLLSLGQQLDAQKVPSRVSEDGTAVEVPQAFLAKARLAAASADVRAGGNVGLEIFSDADFSMTDFAQKVNYQRALQGELARTILSLDGVRSARVHIVLAESGILRRSGTKASAAVFISTADGRALTGVQVRGIQRLVASSVPEISTEAVTVLNDSGASLTKGNAATDLIDHDHLVLKREVDEYLRLKLHRLLQDLAPNAQVTTSVDASLDMKQLRTVTDQPIAAPQADGNERAAGVMVRERQRQRTGGPAQGGSSAEPGDDSSFEYDYKVGNRSEQSVSMPGAIRRLSVSVAMRNGPPDLSSSALEQLVANAVGLDRGRGDTASVVVLAAAAKGSERLEETWVPSSAAPTAANERASARSEPLGPTADSVPSSQLLAIGGSAALVLAGIVLMVLAQRRKARARQVEETTARVRRWLDASQ